jgi:hypothetical protein
LLAFFCILNVQIPKVMRMNNFFYPHPTQTFTPQIIAKITAELRPIIQSQLVGGIETTPLAPKIPTTSKVIAETAKTVRPANMIEPGLTFFTQQAIKSPFKRKE